ncbi:MAG: hypothetical protein ACJAU0_002632 [Flavobacteriales bacterium]|jgi:hypothetical protein
MTIISHLFLALVLCISFAACNTAPSNIETDMINIPGPNGPENVDQPAIKFEESELDFGTIAEGEMVNYTFKFENTGDAPLVLTSVTSQCGCTVMKNWPKEPLAAGEEATIDVEFNSTGRDGQQNKKITVVANTYPAKTQLTIKGVVVGPQTN